MYDLVGVQDNFHKSVRYSSGKTVPELDNFSTLCVNIYKMVISQFFYSQNLFYNSSEHVGSLFRFFSCDFYVDN